MRDTLTNRDAEREIYYEKQMKLSEAKQLLESGHTLQEISKLSGESVHDLKFALGINNEYLQGLHSDGLYDEDIAHKSGLTVAAIRAWRRTQNLKSNYSNKRTWTGEAMRLYEAGKNDTDIAYALGLSISAVNKWRLKAGLPMQSKRWMYGESK